MQGVYIVDFNMCEFGMTQVDSDGIGSVFKPTRVATNSLALVSLLQRKCQGKHRHIRLVNGRAAEAARYPDKLCDAILKGVMVEMAYMEDKGVDEIEELTIFEEMVEADHVEDQPEYWYQDDVTGQELDPKKVESARAEEMTTFKEMEVYEYWTREDMKRIKGHIKVGTRWVDVEKSAGKHRSRLVAMEFATTERDDLFAATPPLAAFRYLVSEATTSNWKNHFTKKLMVLDVKRAFLHGVITRDVFIELPDEDPMKKHGMVGKLKKTMYGTRDAPQAFQNFLKHLLEDLGFCSCKSTPCVYVHDKFGLKIVAHVDDFLCSGEREDLEWLRRRVEETVEVTGDVLGIDAGEVRELKHLGRTLRLTNNGIEVEGDTKVMKSMLEEWDMVNASGVNTPGVRDEASNVEAINEEANKVSKEEHVKYRRGAAKCNYIGLDRADVCFAAKEVSRKMSSPSKSDMDHIKRLIRFLRTHQRFVVTYGWQSAPKEVVAMVDSDWAGCRITRKSTSGGMLFHGTHCILHWSKTQPVVALSSGEAELNSVLKGASEVLGVQTMMKELGEDLGARVRTDSSACVGMVHRQGMGKIKHIEVKQLWIQEKVKKDVLKISKVPRAENPSDCLTHHWSRKEGEEHLRSIGGEWRALDDVCK